MSFGQKGSPAGAGPSGNVPDVLYSGVTSSPFGQPGDLFGSMSPGSQTPYGGLEQRPIPSTPSTAYDPTPYQSAVAQATSDPSNLSASLTGGTTAGGGNWISGTGSEFGEVDNPRYGGYTEPNWNKGAWGDNISGWGTKGVALPNAPRGTVVEVMSPITGKSDYATVIDKGPGAHTGAIIDLTGGTRAALGLDRNFKGPIQYRIVGGPGTPMPAGSQVASATPQQPSQALTQPLTQQPSQQQTQQKKSQQQRPPRRQWRKRVAGITPSFQNAPAELTFLRQAVGGLPYQQSAQPTSPTQTDQTEAT